jgi:hypothetical protein
MLKYPNPNKTKKPSQQPYETSHRSVLTPEASEHKLDLETVSSLLTVAAPKVASAQIQPPPKLSKKLLSLAIATVLGIATLVSLIPRVTVTVSDPANPNDAFSSSITVTNTGYIPLEKVEATFSPGSLTFTNGTTFRGGQANYGTQIRFAGWKPHDLGLDDKFTFALNDMLSLGATQIVSADIAIVVNYEIPYIHWKRKKIFPLFAEKQSNGNFYWYANSLPN